MIARSHVHASVSAGEQYEWVAANGGSQRVSHSSTTPNADELNFRVRDGYGWNLVAMAAVKPINGIEPLYIQIGQYGMYLISCILVQSSKRLDPEHPVDLE